MTPVLDIEPLRLPVLGALHDDLWTVLCDLADRHEADWTVIGGQMVMLHGLQANRSPGRISDDLDLMIDARVRPPMIPTFIATLSELGFVSIGVSPDNVAHRFGRGDVVVDVVSPDGVGERADLRTIGSATTIEVRGGTQALQRTERVPVLQRRRRALVPRPNLVGAFVIKAAAVRNDDHPQRHLRDLAFLCSIVGDPFEARAKLTVSDRRRLRAVSELDDQTHEAWRLLDNPETAYAAFKLLIGGPWRARAGS